MNKEEVRKVIQRECFRSSLFSVAVSAFLAALISTTAVFVVHHYSQKDLSQVEKENDTLLESENIDLYSELKRIEKQFAESISRIERQLMSDDDEPVRQAVEGRSSRLAQSENIEGLASLSRSIAINISSNVWEGSETGKHPRLEGEITLESGSQSPFLVEFSVVAIKNGKEVGYNFIRTAVRNGEGRFNEMLYPSEYPNNFSGGYDIEIKNVIIFEIPNYTFNGPNPLLPLSN